MEQTCAPARGAADAWPAGVPADLPVPPTAEMRGAEKTPDGLTLVRSTTRQSVRDGLLFLTSELQPVGYTLGAATPRRSRRTSRSAGATCAG